MRFVMKNAILTCVILAVSLAVISCGGDQPAEMSGTAKQQVAALSGLDAVIEAGASLEKLPIDYAFDTAGSPCWVDGTLFLTNNNFDPAEASKTMKLTADGVLHELRADNGVTTTIQESGKGTLYCCEMLGHRVVEMDYDGNILRVIAGDYDGRRIDGPNDICVDKKGGIYFTDSQFIAGQEKMQDKPAVYYVKPTGGIIRIIDDIAFPNGLWLSPDETVLYVANTYGRYLLAYDVNGDGTVTNGRDFAELKIPQELIDKGELQCGADGVVVDSAGNIYVATTKGFGIQVIDKDGNHLGNILCDAVTNNVNFGGGDLRTLFVSAKDGIYTIRTRIPGEKAPRS